MRLTLFELQKLFGKRFVIVCLLCIVIANLLLIHMNTRRSDAEANTRLMVEIGSLSLKDKSVFVGERYAESLALTQIDNYLKAGVPANEQDVFKELINEHGDDYESADYPFFTGNLYSEPEYLSAVRSELETVSGYPDYLNEIEKQSNQFKQISIFQDDNFYAEQNVKKTAADYARLLKRDMELDYFPQQGFVAAVTFEYTDFFLLLSILLLVGILISSERDSGMFDYIRTTTRGNLPTAVAKYLVLMFVTFILILLLYSSNLIYCAANYGIGPLSRGIQSLPFLMRSTLPFSLMGYIVLFFIIKWFAACVFGAGVLVIVLLSKRFIIGALVSFLFYGSQLFLCYVIRPNTPLAFLKYINVVSILRVNDWVGGYLNFNVFNRPVSIFMFVLLSAIIMLILFLINFIILFCRLQHKNSGIIVVLSPRRRLKSTTVLKEECYKTFAIGGAGVLLILTFIFQVWQGFTIENFITAEEIYYSHYMIPLSGKYTEKKYQFLLGEQQTDAFQKTYEMDHLLTINAITQKEYDIYYDTNYSVYKRREVLDRIITEKISYIRQNQGAHLIYETGYDILFDKTDTRDLSDTFLSGLVIVLCLANVFTGEKTSGMQKILEYTPLGRIKLIKNKILVACIVALFVTVICVVSRYIQVARDYGFPAFFSPIKSFPKYSLLPNWISIATVSVLSFIARLMSNIAIATGILLISQRMNNVFTVIFTGFFVFCVPVSLALLGVDFMRFLSVYPMYHIPQLLTTPFYTTYLLLFALIFLIYGYFFWIKIGLPLKTNRAREIARKYG